MGALSSAAPAEPGPQEAAPEPLDALLKKVVTDDGLVRYDLLIKHRRELEKLVADLAAPRQFPTDKHKLAFHINAYNLLVVHEVVRRWPIESVAGSKGFFDKQKHRINGASITLNHLENKIIRPMGDPRIHAGLVCAAVSCPPLRNEAYRADKLDRQLDDNTRRWLSDPARNTADRSRLKISSIFKWYAKDFNAGPYAGLHGFLEAHTDGTSPLGKALHESDRPLPVSYLHYDWALNAAAVADVKQ